MTKHQARAQAQGMLENLQGRARDMRIQFDNTQAAARERFTGAVEALRAQGEQVKRRVVALELPLATRVEVEKLRTQVKALNKKVSQLARKVTARSEA